MFCNRFPIPPPGWLRRGKFGILHANWISGSYKNYLDGYALKDGGRSAGVKTIQLSSALTYSLRSNYIYL